MDIASTAFPAGACVWSISNGSEILSCGGTVPRTTDVYIDIRFLSYDSHNEYTFATYPTSQAVASTPTCSARVFRPADARFNGLNCPPSISGELTVSRSHRNRLETWRYAASGRTASPESGTEHDIEVYSELGTLAPAEVEPTDTPWTYLEADEIAESGLGRLNNCPRVKIRSWGASHTHVAIREIEWEFDRV